MEEVRTTVINQRLNPFDDELELADWQTETPRKNTEIKRKNKPFRLLHRTPDSEEDLTWIDQDQDRFNSEILHSLERGRKNIKEIGQHLHGTGGYNNNTKAK